jgi:hypothetical protein
MKNSKLIKKITISGVLLAIGLVITFLLHITGLGIGPYLLPMHFVIILSVLTTGYFGIILAFLIPLFNLMFGLMPLHIAAFLTIELVFLAIILATLQLLFSKRLSNIRFFYHVLVLISILLTKGFLVFGIMLALQLSLVPFGGTALAYVTTTTITGIGGLSLSFIVTPIIYDRIKIRSAFKEEEGYINESK